jgi:hypothetical protein
MPQPNLEIYAARSIAEAIKAALPGVLVEEIGNRVGARAIEWVSFTPLQLTQTFTGRGNAHGVYVSQVTAFSLYGELRGDGDAYAPHALAGRVRHALANTDILVKSYGAASEEHVGVLTMEPVDEQYIDEAGIGVPGGEGVPSTPSNVHGIALTFRATLSLS